MRQSRLPTGGLNVLQAIRQKRVALESLGRKLLDLSIGEPKGPALFSARHAASSAVMSDDEVMHAYQYNGSPAVPKFSEKFIAAHVKRPLSEEDVDYLPISGIKPILGLLPLSCGCATEKLTVATTTNPGYPIPADWCAMHPLVNHYALPLTIQNKFRFSKENIEPSTDLILLNYPHNPSGQVATEPWLRELCEYSEAHDIRLFNDAAYFALSHTEESTTLADVANDYPALSWSEAFTAAKLIGNGTGWHVGAMVGSPDFIADIKEIKGKTDTGFVPPMAVGALEALQRDALGISQVKEIYHERLNLLVNLLSRCGMRSALKPAAGFFSLWEAPTEAFGERIESAEDFNFKMIDEVGVAGVHFPGFLRYAVCADITAMMPDLETAFRRADVKYR